MTDHLARAVNKVVRNDNCSGCGACTLISGRVTMTLTDDYMRPEVGGGGGGPADRAEAASFNRVCPGARLVAPSARGRREHATFGPYLAAFEGFAADANVRDQGSSAGVLTALTRFLIDSGRAREVIGTAASRSTPSRTVPVRITTREQALQSAGSRYAPVSNLAAYSPLDGGQAIVGKPCEVSAATQWFDDSGETTRPVLLSFFCAGVPAQSATNKLVEQLGVRVEDLESLRYRGEGWPGSFVATDASGNVGRLSYEDSWGAHLGKTVQWRCKLCPDGTGGHADVAVGDFWQADERGFPIFDDQQGNSAVIARTRAGLDLLESAARAGVIVLSPVDLDEVAAIQPLQVKRKQQLAGRLVGRMLAGKSVPRYRGYDLLALARPFWRQNIAGAKGAAKRSAPRWVRKLGKRLSR